MKANPFAGDPDGMRSLVRRITADAESVSDGRGFVHDARSLAHGSWKGAAAQAFTERASSLGPAAARAAAQLEAMADVLRDYAAEVTRIQDDARQIRSAQVSVADDIAHAATAGRDQRRLVHGPEAVEADAVQLARMVDDARSLDAEQSRLAQRWDELVQRRADADRRAATGLADEQTLGWFASFAAAEASTDEAFLAGLATLRPRAIEVLGADEFVASRLRSMTAEQVAAWWDSMGERERDAFIAAFPAVIGNLDGVAYWARDKANRGLAKRYLTDARREDCRLRTLLARTADAGARVGLQRALDDARVAVQAYENFDAGTRTPLSGLDGVPRQMIAFRPGHPPLGAFAVGDLDTATSVSFLVPGMGSSLADTTHYMRAGANVMSTQRKEGTTDTAMVAWIGYVAPPPPPDLSVLALGHANAGAPFLSADLAAFRATRPDAAMHVLAHSYGSTTAALTLAGDPSLRVATFVTLGSAGIPNSVPNAAATHAAHVYAAEGREPWAALGRTSPLHPIDPRVDFGATVLPTEARGPLAGVDRHDLLAHKEGSPGSPFGYLDAGTRSLDAVARVLE